MRIALLAFALVLSAANPVLADDAALNRLIADYEVFWLRESPGTAAQLGDRSALSRLPDVSVAGDVRRKAALEAFRARLSATPTGDLSDGAKLNHAFLAWVLEGSLAEIAFDDAAMPFSSDGGFDRSLNYGASTVPMRSAADATAWIAKLEAAPIYWRDSVANARRGVKRGFTQPRTTVEAVLKEARAAAARPIDGDPLLAPLSRLPASIPAAEQAMLQARGRAAVDVIRPLQRDYAAFLEREYLPAARKALGARTLPGGEAYYRRLVREHTTSDLTPDQIHQIGQTEVARIRAEMAGVMAETRFQGDLPAFLAMLRTEPRFYATSREALLKEASEIAKRIDDQLPAWFATLPRLTYGVRPVPREIEAGYTTGRYFSGSPAQGRAGGYMVNTGALDQRALYELPALTLHEAVPGHHLQIALSQELTDVPAFRREAGVTAFTEGWGLYAEKLGGEMGIYRDPYERFGRLSYEMWRACRLVADTGLHWKGWSLEQARACFTENTALSPLNIEVELARYVSWPGQALAYKIGEMKHVELRERARAALGPRFDIRRYHDAVLLAGPLPLSLLEARIDGWIATERAKR